MITILFIHSYLDGSAKPRNAGLSPSVALRVVGF